MSETHLAADLKVRFGHAIPRMRRDCVVLQDWGKP
jgi:hypothetical protein